MNERAVALVRDKCEAQGTEKAKEAAEACSKGLLREYNNWVHKMSTTTEYNNCMWTSWPNT